MTAQIPTTETASGSQGAQPSKRSVGPGDRVHWWLGPYLAYLTLQVVQLGALMALAPRLFWFDDSQRQFGPMAWWLGRNLNGGRPPLMDPDLGMGGNLVADLQYGTLDPLHWVFQYAISRFDNFIGISRGYGAFAVILLGTGVLWVLLRYRVRPILAVAGALGVASSGFFLWFGGSWWPLMWSVAWLPPGYAPGVTLDEYQATAYPTEGPVTAVVRGNFGDDMGWSSGVLAGNGNLIAGLKPGFASVAVWQDRLDQHWCRYYEGDTCSTPQQLLAKVEGTSKAWIDVLSADTVLLEKPAEPEIEQHFDAGWIKSAETDGWIEYRRDRITVAEGVRVATTGWTAGLAYVGGPMETYVVSTEAQPGSLILRTPFWPGLRGTLDGQPLRVGSVAKSVVKIDLPARLAEAELDVYYEPVGARLFTAATATGVVIMMFAAAVSLSKRRRR